MKKLANYPSELGYFQIGYGNEAITSINIVDEVIGPNEINVLTTTCFMQITEYLEGKRTVFDFVYLLKGTDFQVKVWKEVARIPYGETRSYKEIAITINQPTASRAVGMAVNKNPLLLVIPCHRVIGSNGSLVGYAAGLSRKEQLLALEERYKNKTEHLFDR